jgi:hypothetical protein
MHCRVEPTDTSKQINKSKLRLAIVLDNLFTGTFRSVLKVNEFTLAGAVLADSLAGVRAKETRGADSLLA